MPQQFLFVDVQNRQLVGGFNNSIQASLPNVFQGDTLALIMRFMQPTGTATGAYTDIDFSAATVKVGIGTVAASPTAGTFTLTDPDSSTSTGPIPYNATAAQVQTAIRTLANWSLATVTGPNAGPWVITNGANATRSTLQGTAALLLPVSQVVVFSIQSGDGSNPSVQEIELFQAAIAYQNSWTPSSAASITIQQVTLGAAAVTGPPAIAAINEVQSVTLNGSPYAGTWTLSFGGQTTNALAYNATPAAVQIALQALSSIGAGNCSVGGVPGAYIIVFTGTLGGAAQSLVTATAAGLTVPLTLSGTLALNVAAVKQALGESESINETLEINITPAGGYAATVLQAPITILNNLLKSAAEVSSPTDTFLTESTADARYEMKLTAGLQSIGSGVGDVTVAGLGLSAAPSGVFVSVKKATSGALNIFATLRGDATTDGFTVDLSALTDSSSYKLVYVLLP